MALLDATITMTTEAKPDPDPDPNVLGHCPRCQTTIKEEWTLITYERRDGRAAYAECPECGDVVHPE